MSQETSARVDVFREQALKHWQSRNETFVPLRTEPPWIDRSYQLILLFALVASAYLLFGTINEYASGPAVVLARGQQEVTANAAGVIAAFNVKTGDHVAPGTELARLADQQERAELDQIQAQIDATLARVFKNPADPMRETLVSLQASRVAAKARLEATVLRSPIAGVVRELRSRVGQHTAQGDVVVTLARAAEPPMVLLLMPGHSRPRLDLDTPFRLELNGYPFSFVPLDAEVIGEDVISSQEALRFLGPEAPEGLKLDDSVVLVRTRPLQTSFSFNGDEYSLYPGMIGRGESRLRKESILFALLPALRKLGDI